MGRTAKTISAAFGVLIVATPLLALSAQHAGEKRKHADLVISDADHGKTKPAKKGDLIEVRLPATNRVYWALQHPNPFVRNVLGKYQSDPAPRKGPFPTLDDRFICVNQYEFAGDSDSPVPLKLICCVPQTPEERRAGIAPSDPSDEAFWTRRRVEQKEISTSKFRTGQFKEGMVFEVTLQATDKLPKGQPVKTKE
jgi:hypothetical protein